NVSTSLEGRINHLYQMSIVSDATRSIPACGVVIWLADDVTELLLNARCIFLLQKNHFFASVCLIDSWNLY
ncbi:hypothetical protein C5739_03490, partial [Klebsiella pneumoniae]